MSLLQKVKQRFSFVQTQYGNEVPNLLDLIKASQDAKFGDYQANFAMPIGKKQGRPPREVAQEIIEQIELGDFFEKVEVAGPGFINLTLSKDFLIDQVKSALADEAVGVEKAESPKTVVIDYSSPNVAKPMHVGHIRSTVIGDAISKVLRFLGHNVITDNHLGDWGTQFGMIIYGYKHFANQESYSEHPVAELSRIYRYVRKIMDHFEKEASLPKLQQEVAQLKSAIEEHPESAPDPAEKKAAKKHAKQLESMKKKLAATEKSILGLNKYFTEIVSGSDFAKDLQTHSNIAHEVLAETAKLHEGDSENLALWKEFMPHCRDEIQRVYSRLNIEFDHEFGESHYHSMLNDIVEEFKTKGLAEPSEGALCVFLKGFEAPMIIQKRDGAFLYSTTDLATIKFRMDKWKPDAILYVVDFRQGDHFEKLFAAAEKWGYADTEFYHVKFGTVMDENGKPYKTRSGDTVGLEGLLNHAVAEAHQVVQSKNEELNDEESRDVAEVVGLGGLKYFDLSQHRASDYVFSYEKMLALKGDTAPYVQYSFARVHGIFRKGGYDPKSVDVSAAKLVLDADAERALAVKLLQFQEALEEVLVEYKPNMLTSYLFELAQMFAVFFEQCPVLKAESEELKQSRLLLCDLTARTIKTGLSLLGIEVRERM